MHGNQFWWVWPLRFQSYGSFFLTSKQPKFPFGPWAIVHGGQKIELAQKIYVSGGQLEMHGKQFWWV